MLQTPPETGLMKRGVQGIRAPRSQRAGETGREKDVHFKGLQEQWSLGEVAPRAEIRRPILEDAG